jgi:branched-chain amino acid transport system substrate-binding protein
MLILATAGAASAEKKYDPGASDSEIKLGNTGPYSGPASTYGIVLKTQAAYFKMINDNGGINGRKINFISYDDAFSPPKTVEQTRKLVEGDEVLFMFGTLGTAPNAAIHKYLNGKKVPQLFVASGASRWNDPKHFPWTMGILPSYRSEARAYGSYILANYPGRKIGVLYQNDDFGKDHIAGLKDVLKEQYDTMVVATATFEVTDPTVDSQVVKIMSAKPDIFINLGAPKFTAQAIKRAAELNWRPIQIISNVAISVSSVLQPAGIENSKGILSMAF